MKKRFLLLFLLLFLFVGCNNTEEITTIDTSDDTTQEIITGIDGRSIELQVTGNIIQWRYTDEDTWTDLFSLEDLSGLGIKEMTIDANGELIITYTDNTEVNLGNFDNKHLVQFIGYDDQILAIHLVETCDSVIPPVPPQVDGHYFAGWSEEYSNIQSDLAIYAYYMAEFYTVYLDAQGGTCDVAGVGVDYGVPLELPIPVRSGYTFLGWFLGLDANSPQLFDGTVISSNLTVYARWQTSSSATVSTEEELMAALENVSYQEIIFANDITITEEILINRPLTIFGNGNTLTTENPYNLFMINPEFSDVAFTGYPNDGYLEINDLEITNDIISSYYTGYNVIEIYEINKFDLRLNNVNIHGDFEYGIASYMSSGINIYVNNSSIDVKYNGLNLFEVESCNINFNATSISSVENIYLYGVNNSYFNISNSYFALTDENNNTAHIAINDSDNNLYEIYNSTFETLNSSETGIVNGSFEDNNQYFEFEDCLFIVNNPVFVNLFYSDTGLSDYEFANSTVKIIEGITAIEDYAFEDNGITNVILPQTLETIGVSAFSNMHNLEFIIIPEGVTTIDDYAFDGAYLASAVIPASVTYIGEYAFYGNYDPFTLYINESAVTSGWDANFISAGAVFSNQLFVETVDGVTYVGMSDLTAHVINYQYDGITSDVEILKEIEYNGEFYTVTKINPLAFSYDKELTSITIPNTITSIGDEAFYNAENLENLYFEENSQLETIGYQAFGYNKKLRSVEIPASVTLIKEYAFTDTLSLMSFTFETGSTITEIPMGMLQYAEKVQTLEIPETVTAIGGSAFYGMVSLNSITFLGTSQLETIGSFAFNSCVSLESFDLPVPVTSIGSSAFRGCENLQTFNIPLENQLTYIGERAFTYNYKLTSIWLPDTLTHLGIEAFSYCESLTEINIPAGITKIESRTFINCYELHTVTFALTSSLTIIDVQAFLRCESLANITLPETVTTIGYYSFGQCLSLTEFYIPGSVTMIDDYAFYNNQWITEYTFGNIYNLTYIGGYSFYQNLSLVEFFIPDTIIYIGANVFYANHDLVLNCEPISQPALWDINWNANGATTVNWAVNHRTITLVLDNGEPDILIFQKIGTVVIQPTAPTKAGWDFDGWYIYDGVDFIPYSFTTMPEEDLTVYALYTPI